MTINKIKKALTEYNESLISKGVSKANELIISDVVPANDGFGYRVKLSGYRDRCFLRMNSNSYLGLGLHPEMIEAETQTAEQFGTGPGAVRFISGTYQAHIDLESKLAEFHDRESALLMSSAYATVLAVLPQFITEQTLVVSDSLNHNCIINAIQLAAPATKAIYQHLDMDELEQILLTNRDKVSRVCVVTDGIFSMRGDHVPLAKLNRICKQYEQDFPEGIMTIVDDSHGVGAFGETGRGVEEHEHARADILIATLGKAFAVNGGYVVADKTVVEYLRETAPCYIYSNPITPAEASAALMALNILDSEDGKQLMGKLKSLAERLRSGLSESGFETIQSEHPIVPLLIRDTETTTALTNYLFDNNILVTGLNYPVVPKGDEEIRMQVSASHTEKDIDYVLEVLNNWSE